jgi:hypothetical protein
MTAGGIILAACTTNAPPTAAPTAAAPTAAAPTAGAAATTAPTAAAAASVKDRLKALGVLPGSPDHNKGWETILPNVSTPASAAPIVIMGAKRVEIGDAGVNDDPKPAPCGISTELFKIDWKWPDGALGPGTKYSLWRKATRWMMRFRKPPPADAGSLQPISPTLELSASADWLKAARHHLDGARS